SSVSFGGLVAGFAGTDQLDLKDIGFGSGTTLTFAEAAGNLSGTLTVTDGAHTAQIALLGQYTAGEFSAKSDGRSGTLITAPGRVPARNHVRHPRCASRLTTLTTARRRGAGQRLQSTELTRMRSKAQRIALREAACRRSSSNRDKPSRPGTIASP